MPVAKKSTKNTKNAKKKVKEATKKDSKKSKKTKVKGPKITKNHKWFIVNTYSGHENRVAALLKARIKANKVEDLITKILVPTQDKIVISKGKKRTVKEKIFPGYVLLQMVLDDNTWNIVRNTEGVTGFVGTKKQPSPLNKQELKSILAFTKVKQPSYQTSFSIGDAVKVVDGPFADFVGSISEINRDKGQVKVLLSVFGRETPVVMDFLQVKKL